MVKVDTVLTLQNCRILGKKEREGGGSGAKAGGDYIFQRGCLGKARRNILGSRMEL